MNLQKYIYMILTVIGITACVKEIVIEVPVIIEPEKVNVTLGVRTSQFSTKAAQDHNSTEPTLEERRIFNYAILIFDASQKLEAALTAAPYDPNNPASEGIEYTGPLRFVDEDGKDIVVELTSGVKRIFALVNASQPLLDERDALIAKGNSTLQDFTNWILNVGEQGGLGLITGTTSVPIGKDRGFMMTCEDGMSMVTLEPREEEEPATVLLTVGRAMAKVSVASDLTLAEQPNGELTDITYKIVNNPYEMYVVPSILNNVLVTPYSKSILAKADTNLYFESPGQLDDNYTPVSKKDSLTQVYCMEHAITTLPTEEEATTAIVKGTYVPHTLYQADGITLYTTYKKGEHFWRIANIQNGQRISYNDKYYGEDPTDYLGDNQEAVKYSKGETYYAFYLKNANSDRPYSVKRNSYYNIDITRVNHAGEEGEEVVDPEDPDPDTPEPSPDPDPDPDPNNPEPGPDPTPKPEPDPNPRLKLNIRITDWQGINQGSTL